MITYLITGGAGFIGSNLVGKLIDSSKVIVLDNFNDYYDPFIKERNISEYKNNPNFKLYCGDIRDYKILNQIFIENNIDCVIHLAAMAGVRNSINNPMLYQDVNCNGTLTLLEIMRLFDVKRIIFASSSSVYGNLKEVPFREDMQIDRCISPYATTKISSEIMLYTYHSLYDMDSVILRFFTAYGPRQRPDLAISKFTNLILQDKYIHMYGDGSTYRDYTYIDDIINGIVGAINYIFKNYNTYEIINIGSSNPIKLKYMVEVISKELHKEAKIKQMDNQPGDVVRTYADITKARNLLNYEPKITFEEGIKKYVKSLKR